MCAAWPDWYGPAGEGDALHDLGRRTRDSGLPFGVVALMAGTPVGTAAMASTSYSALAGEPVWLTGLVVDPTVQGRWIASALVAAIEGAAATALFSAIYATTINAERLMLRRGWHQIRCLPDGHKVMRKELT